MKTTKPIFVAGALVAVLDGLDAIIAYGIVLGLDPVTIYQFVASGMLGPSAYAGGIATAFVGLAVHCLVALSAAAVFTFAARRVRWLIEHPAASGSLFGIGVFAFMSFIVIPLSLIPAAPFSLPLFLNGVIGHALFVGLPIAYVARHYLGPDGTQHRELQSRHDARLQCAPIGVRK